MNVGTNFAPQFNDFDEGSGDYASRAMDCGLMSDGFCSFAGSEHCDWHCPLLDDGVYWDAEIELADEPDDD